MTPMETVKRGLPPSLHPLPFFQKSQKMKQTTKRPCPFQVHVSNPSPRLDGGEICQPLALESLRCFLPPPGVKELIGRA